MTRIFLPFIVAILGTGLALFARRWRVWRATGLAFPVILTCWYVATPGMFMVGVAIWEYYAITAATAGTPQVITPTDTQELARLRAAQFGVPGDLFLGLVEVESGWDENAVSSAGAMGLAQLMPVTAYEVCDLDDPFDADQNLTCGASYLGELLQRYQGDVDVALSAYNTGPGTVARCGGCVAASMYAKAVRDAARRYATPILPYTSTAVPSGGLGWHSWPPGRDFSGGCGAVLVAPIDGTVSYVGREWGYIGPHARDKLGDEKYNTMLVIDGDEPGSGAVLLHGRYTVRPEDRVIKGVTIIGYEDSLGNSTGCHTHIGVRSGGEWVDVFGR